MKYGKGHFWKKKNFLPLSVIDIKIEVLGITLFAIYITSSVFELEIFNFWAGFYLGE